MIQWKNKDYRMLSNGSNRVVIICAKYTSSLIVFHGKNADALIPVDNREYEDEKIAEDPFNDEFVNEPDFIVEVDDDEIVEGA